jgi:hypothetical protein
MEPKETQEPKQPVDKTAEEKEEKKDPNISSSTSTSGKTDKEKEAERAKEAEKEFKKNFVEAAYQYLFLLIAIATTLNAAYKASTPAAAFPMDLFFAIAASCFMVIFGGYIKAIRGQEIKILLSKLRLSEESELDSKRQADFLKSKLDLLDGQTKDLDSIKNALVNEVKALVAGLSIGGDKLARFIDVISLDPNLIEKLLEKLSSK